MSRIRGVFPLFLATTFGILNGVTVFGPAFKDQERQRLEKEQEGLEATKDVPEQLQTFKDVETGAIAGAETEPLPKSTASEKSRWSMIRISEHGESGSKGEVGKDQQGRGDRQEHRAESTNSN